MGHQITITTTTTTTGILCVGMLLQLDAALFSNGVVVDAQVPPVQPPIDPGYGINDTPPNGIPPYGPGGPFGTDGPPPTPGFGIGIARRRRRQALGDAPPGYIPPITPGAPPVIPDVPPLIPGTPPTVPIVPPLPGRRRRAVAGSYTSLGNWMLPIA